MAAPALSVLSICSGVGALDLAVRIASPGARTVGHLEREGYAASLLATRMAEGALDEAPIWDDLGTFDGGPWRGKVDCIIAGLPCQPYSAAGKRKGHNDERAIWPEFMRIVGEVQPTMVFMENVPTFLRWFQPVGERISGMGYRYKAGIFSAAEVGASQLRERLFILAAAADPAIERGWRLARLTRGEIRDPDGNGHSLADTSSGGLRKRQRLLRAPGGQPDPDGCRRPLAYAEGQRGEDGPATSERPTGLTSASGIMGYADDPGLPDGRRLAGTTWGAEPFPPGPNDRERWAAILAACPDKAPAQSRIRRLAYGTARGLARGSRIDELRGAGNAVVALQAAYALVTLARRLDVML
ncbi:MAG: DNA cytosine methyltransferase [Patescibacteria group bacterium]|nr:DNA cytosine methyltransferase [Patescibacteria group bacterium]